MQATRRIQPTGPVAPVPPKEATDFLGLPFQAMPVPQAARYISANALGGDGFWYVVTPNVDHMVRMTREPVLKPLYERSKLILNDSRIIELLASWDKLDLPASPGADVVQRLFAKEIDPDEPVVVVGCTASEITALKAKFGLSDVRWHDAPMGLRRNPEAIQRAADFMADNPARFHFLCVGSPQQEMIAQAASEHGGVTGVGLCCGASIDFLTGKSRRAPEWMREMRLEWFYRLTNEPHRLTKRYLVDGPKIFRLWWADRKRRKARAAAV
ncbi:WecB/TagA/CpsF family glycosyltransferase [Henriciella aquimarina]|uniref:WecB/TagA/CpsF family glycosyltransferase n=1 Tax=Henriciella aquimarina TaxID=545261 RepID=UPI0009FE121B|nr:WecB/TagA/CpsF family glycosyltransferase [Henriciella aquimarina]